MKTMKKFVSLALALMMALALMAPAFAQDVTYAGEDATTDGSLTISNAAKGETYAIYKLFDATYGEAAAEGGDVPMSYTLAGDIPSGLADYFVKATEGSDVVTAEEAATDADGKLSEDAVTALKAWATNEGGIPTAAQDGAVSALPASAVADGSELTFKNLPYGYYVVVSQSSNGGAISVDTLNPHATLVDKNTSEPGKPSKTVKTATDNKVAQIGETVTYTVEFTTVNWVTPENGSEATEKVVTYTIEDTLPDFLSDVTVTGIKVIEGEKETVLVGEGAIGNAGVTGVDTFGTGKEIVINWTADGTENTDSRFANGAKIVLTYTAVVNEKIVNDAHNGAGENEVSVYPNSKEPQKDKEKVYTYDFTLFKYTKNGETETKLEGAEFTLSKNEDGSEPISFVAVEGKGYRVATQEEIDDTAVETTTTLVAGEVTIDGLATGTYYLTETKAPDGYNKLTEPVTVIITAITDAENNTTDNYNVMDKADGNPLTDKTLKVANLSGGLLPSTGGIGTTIFYVVGGVLVVGAAILLMTRKRVRDEE